MNVGKLYCLEVLFSRQVTGSSPSSNKWPEKPRDCLKINFGKLFFFLLVTLPLEILILVYFSTRTVKLCLSKGWSSLARAASVLFRAKLPCYWPKEKWNNSIGAIWRNGRKNLKCIQFFFQARATFLWQGPRHSFLFGFANFTI